MLLADSIQRKSPIKKLSLTIAEGVKLVPINTIFYFKSDGNYTIVFMKGERNLLITKSILKFEELLDPDLFLGVHHSYLLNYNLCRYILKQ